ncbi:MAG: electron transfer flavoprotein subunit alpha/FixB family protein [Eubacteriales bacterium]|nr:electron transfer flavoprotein subunit alpha/FixB family protein [Eubacteriales bacterium]
MILTDKDHKDSFRNVWALAEVLSGEIQPVTHELIGAARALADARGSEVWAAVLGEGTASQAEELIAYGADKVVVVDEAALRGFSDELECGIVEGLIRKYKPEILLGAATARGRALMPRIAVKSVCGLTADCTELGIDPQNGDLLQTRPAFGGNILATIRSSNHRPQLATVRPRVMKALPKDASRKGEVIRERIEAGDAGKIKQILEIFQDKESVVNLGHAQIIVSGGRGVKGPQGFELLRGFAAKIGAAVGASRAAIDSGWISYSHQIGQTGQTVQAKVYIACGISGQIQHLVGMQSSDLIIAIDKNPDTPMMQLADIAIVGDLFEVIPEIIREIDKV